MSSFGDSLANSASQFVKRATYSLNGSNDDYPTYSYSTRKYVIIHFVIIVSLLGITLLGALVSGLVWYFRQRKRNRLYGPMAQYYRDRGFGRTGMVGYNGAMYVPQVVYVPFGGQPGAPQQPGGPIVGFPMQYPQGPMMNQGNPSQSQLQPVNNSVAYPRSFVSGGGGPGPGLGANSGGPTDVAAGLTERDITGPISPMRDFNGATSHDPFASPRIGTYAHLQPQFPPPSQPPPQPQPQPMSQLQPELHMDQRGDIGMYGITEVHGAPEMTERRGAGAGAGATRVTNSLSFYAVPMGSQPNLSGNRQ